MYELDLDDVQRWCEATGCALLLPEEIEQIRTLLGTIPQPQAEPVARLLHLLERAV